MHSAAAPADDLTNTASIWYHGTSTEAGLDVGDWLDPARGQYEACVWLTSSREVAEIYAGWSAARGGAPIVCEIEISEEAIVVLGDETSDADVAVIVAGEHGVPMAAVVRDYSACVRAVHVVE